MKLEEYYKVRDLNPKEIKQAIDDFKIRIKEGGDIECLGLNKENE